ncbi:MAG: glutathione S-transferase [Gammaproteobacteria bacterium]|jgi:glutathione S-transferase
MLTLYGRVYSRAPRVLWAAEEMNVPYKHVSADHKAGDTAQCEYLEINPNGKIPAMVDGDQFLFGQQIR